MSRIVVLLLNKQHAMPQEADWWYTDPRGVEHGPVPARKILNWLKKVPGHCRRLWGWHTLQHMSPQMAS